MKIGFLKFLALSVFIISACKDSKNESKIPQAEVKDLQWLAGTWESTSEAGRAIEQWDWVNDSVMVGFGRTQNADSSWNEERLSLEMQQGRMFYTPIKTIDSLPVAYNYILSTSKKDTWIFENGVLPFPTKIKYFKINENQFKAELVGKNKFGQWDSVAYNFNKMK